MLSEHPAQQDGLFPDPAAERERITRIVAQQVPSYGQGTPENSRNPLDVTLRGQPPMFAFGVKVRDVVDLVCDLTGVLLVPRGRT
jgi:hypothetical protein